MFYKAKNILPWHKDGGIIFHSCTLFRWLFKQIRRVRAKLFTADSLQHDFHNIIPLGKIMYREDVARTSSYRSICSATGRICVDVLGTYSGLQINHNSYKRCMPTMMLVKVSYIYRMYWKIHYPVVISLVNKRGKKKKVKIIAGSCSLKSIRLQLPSFAIWKISTDKCHHSPQYLTICCP